MCREEGGVMKRGDIIQIGHAVYRILSLDSGSFCLNNLTSGGVLCHVAWKWNYLENSFAEQAIKYDVKNQTTGLYSL